MNSQYLPQPPSQPQAGFGGYHNVQGMMPPLRTQPTPSDPSLPTSQLGGFSQNNQSPKGPIESQYQQQSGFQTLPINPTGLHQVPQPPLNQKPQTWGAQQLGGSQPFGHHLASPPPPHLSGPQPPHAPLQASSLQPSPQQGHSINQQVIPNYPPGNLQSARLAQSGPYPPQQPGEHSNPPHLPPQLHSQLAGMTLNGPPQQNNFAGGPPSMGIPPSSFPPAVNGMSPPDLGYMNGPGAGHRLPQPQQNMFPPLPQVDVYNQRSYNYPSSHPQSGYHQSSGGGYKQDEYQSGGQGGRGLNPDNMPNPMEVINEDQKNKGGVFFTNQRGLMPPLVTTNFVVQDQGNCSPRFMRSTMYNVPVSTDLMKQTSMPFGLVISPLARTLGGEAPPPLVDTRELGPVRCARCKAYMCPFMQFNDGGRKFQCLFCKATTNVPDAYFQHLDHTGQRIDRYERPELVLGAYDFIATKEYCKEDKLPNHPAMIFMIDVSYNNMKSGLVNLLCSQMKEILRNLPRESNAERSTMRVGFVTYNNSVHFYNVKACLAQPQMLVVGDTNEMFMPLLDGFLVDPVESEAVIESLMDQIPKMFADTRETETILGPVIQAGMEAFKAAECNGKLLIFHTSLPTAEAPGKLKNRDDRKLLATDKEKTVLNPQNTYYNTLAQECVGVGCSVDLYVMNNSYVDLATIGQVCRLTGGEVFKYTYFQANIDGERLIADLKYNIGRPIVFDAVMRVRTSTGVRPTDFYGHFFMSNTTDMDLAAVDCDKAVALEIKHDDKLTEEEGVYIQVALLHTSCSGQRRVRILNLSLNCCVQMADLYRACELDTIINFFAKQSLYRLRETPPKQVKESLISRCAMILACYRKNCASPSSAGQLILPECTKLLPLYMSCLIKSDAIAGGSDMTIDDRSFVMYTVNVMDIPSSVVYFYPRLISLHDIDVESSDIPSPLRCSAEKLTENGAYLLDNGIHMFLWFGMALSNDWVQAVFGVPSAGQINTDDTRLPDFDNPLSQRLNNLIARIRVERHRFMRLTLVRQQDKMEMVLKHFLIEDRGMDGAPSYIDFLCHMHKEIRTYLS